MATIGNYGSALGGALKQTAGGIVKGFGYGLKGAMLSEMPGLVAGYGAFSSLRQNARSVGQTQQAPAQTTPTTPQTRPSVTGNPFAQMVQQLAQINSNTAMAASVAKAAAQAEQYKMMFEEEKAREQAQQNQALIDAIKNSGMGGGGSGAAAPAAEPSKNNFLESFLGGAVGALGKMIFDGLLKGLSKLRTIIVAGFAAAMPFLGKMLTKILSFAFKRALFLIPFIGPILGGAALAYDVADMAGAFDGDKGDDSGTKNPSRGGGKGGKGAKDGKNNTLNEPMQFDAMGNATGVGPSTPEDQGVSQAYSPVGKATTKGANKTLGVKWRVPLRDSYTVTSEHEEKRGPPKYKKSYTHKGVDLALYQGAPVVAAADGMIIVNSSDARSGNFVMMDHGNGYTTFYAHLLLSHSLPGTKVTAGNVIGYVGSSGFSSGPHLHFEIRLNGVSKNPRGFMQLGEKAQLTKVDREAEIPKPGPADSGESADPKKASGQSTAERKNSKFNVPGYAAQVNTKLTDNAVTRYYKALSDGKTEAEAKKLALEVASTNLVAKQAVEKASEKVKAEVNKTSAIASPFIDIEAVDANKITTSATPLIQVGDAGVAESMANKTPAWVDVYLRKVAAKQYYTDRETAKRTQEVLKELGGIKENTRITAKEVKSNRITMSGGKFKSPDQMLREANKQFTDSLQKQLTKTISSTLMSALYPGGYKNVSQKTASGQMYRGEQLSKMLGVTPALTKLGTSLFGKQYGPAFGQIFSKAATAYMEVGARSVAKGIFGSMGMNSDQANILGGQILGNLAKGTQQSKVTALEQVIFGLSGGKVALGPETIFAKYGFATPAEGVGYMANVLGASMMGPIDSALGTTPLNMRNMDPRMKQMGAFGGYGGEYGGLPTGMSRSGMPSTGTLQAAAQNNPYMQVTEKGMVVLADNVPQLTKDIAAQLNLAKQAEIDAQKIASNVEIGSDERAAAQRQISAAQYEQDIRSNELLASIASRGLGSGTNVSIGGSGGGGFFSGGGSLAEVGNMALDMGKSAITQKVVQAMGIKNPYMALLASFAVNKGVSYLGGKAFDMFSGTSMGKSVTGTFSGYGNTLSNAYGTYAPEFLGGYDPTTASDMYTGQVYAANQAAAAAAATEQAAAFSAAAGETAATSTTSLLPGFEAVTPYLPYIPAVVALMKGDVGAALGYGIGAYAGVAIGASLGASFATLGSAAGPLGALAGFVIGSVLAGIMGSSAPTPPDPAVWRIIRVRDNNNINAIVDLQAPREEPPKEFYALADSLIRVGFNTTKSAEVSLKKPTPFDFIHCYMDKNKVLISLRTGSPDKAGNDIDLGKPDKTFSAGKAASQIVKHITDAFKAAYAADTTALDEASKLLNRKTFDELGGDLAKNLKTGKDKIDTTIDKGVFGGTTAEDAIITAGRNNAPMSIGGEVDQNSGAISGTTPMVYSMKEGKYVELPTENVLTEGEDGTPTSVRMYMPNVLMLDKNGNPIYDKNSSGGIDLADIVKPTLTTSSSAIISGTAATTDAAGTQKTGDVNVTTVADNKQTNNQSLNTYYTSMLSKTRNPIKDAMLQTAMPA